jgi:hypothetical protein
VRRERDGVRQPVFQPLPRRSLSPSIAFCLPPPLPPPLPLPQVMEMALDHVAGGPGAEAAGPLHVSYDIDAVDPALAPATGTAVPGGLSFREAHYVVEALAEAGLLGSMDLAEVNPDAAAAGAGAGAATAALGVDLVASALGRRIMPPAGGGGGAAATSARAAASASRGGDS